MRLDDLEADDLFALVVAAFHQHLRLHALDQLKRRIFLEDHDEVGGLQGGEHLGAGDFVLDRARGALQAAGGGVAVDADDEAVAQVYEKRGIKTYAIDQAEVDKWKAVAKTTCWKEYADKSASNAEFLKLSQQVSA